MNSPIALVGDLSPTQVDNWLTLLQAELPDEIIIEFSKLSSIQKQQCELAIVANPNPVDIAQLPNLVWLHSLWAGVEKLVAAFKADDLKIVRLIDPYLTEAMSEAVLAWSLYLHRDMPHYQQAQTRAEWRSKLHSRPNKKTIGVLGLGELGSASAQRLAANGFNVLGWSRNPKQIEGIIALNGETGLSELLSQSDIVIVLVPLTQDTHHLLNQERLSLMKPTASIINFARGGIVDTQALVKRLDEKHLAHAVLDVFDQEPLPKDSPLWQHKSITILPHISAQTNPSTASGVVAKNIKHYRETYQIPTCINYKTGY